MKGCFLYLYLVVDLFSRRIMGWRVHEEASSAHAAAFIRQSWQAAGCPEGLVLHSDNGGPMKSAAMLATLQWLGGWHLPSAALAPRTTTPSPRLSSAR